MFSLRTALTAALTLGVPRLLMGAWIGLLINLPATTAHAVDITSSTAAEHHERNVDEVALLSQEVAISRLLVLLKKYKNSRQEAPLLSKLAELQSQKSSILFRLSHGGTKGKAGLTAYHESLNTAINTLTTLITKYPTSPEMPLAYYTRGKSYEELEKKTQAAQDFQFLVAQFPNSEQSSPAYMSLAEFAIEAGNHQVAINYLKEIEKRPEDPHYPFALFKMAWAYYNLKDVDRALSYAEKQITYYNTIEKANGTNKAGTDDPVTSDSALKENTLLDVAVFYFDGFEKDEGKYSLENALSYFKKLENGPILGKMMFRYSKLLRSRSMEKELVAWKNLVLSKEPNRAENLDIIMITYEFQQNKRNYPALVEGARDFKALYTNKKAKESLKPETVAKAQKMILDTAETMQGLIVKNKATPEAKELSRTLAALYDVFTQVVAEEDPRIPQVHYNLAETLYTIQDFDGATANYRWITDHLRDIKDMNKAVLKSVADAPLKAIAARYEVLRLKKLIPGEIKAVALGPEKSGEHDQLAKKEPLLAEWIKWIDTENDHRDGKEKGNAASNSAWENFCFEANRAIYAQGDIRLAMERLEKFALDHPTSSYAIPSATLVLDTLTVSSSWELLYQRALDYKKVAAWKGLPFGKQLGAIASSSLFKQLEIRYHGKAKPETLTAERAKELKQTLKDADDFLKEYKDSAQVAQCLSIAAAAALALGDQERAKGYLSRLIALERSPAHMPFISDGLLSRAKIAEDNYDFTAATGDYRTYLSLNSSPTLDDLRKKTLALAYISNTATLKSLLSDPTVCTASEASPLNEECENYRTLLKIAGPAPDHEQTLDAFNRFRKLESGQAKALLAIYALQGAHTLAFRDRNVILRAVGMGWKDLDSITKFTLLPYLNTSIVKAFELNRAAMKDVAPLRADERYINSRVEVIRELENAVTKIMDLPWSKIRAGTMNSLASVYQDLAQGLTDISPPKGLNEQEVISYQETIRRLVLPFQDKAQEIRSKAFEIASRSSIEEDAIVAIAGPFFTENPSQAKKYKSDVLDAEHACTEPKNLKFIDLSTDYLPILEAWEDKPREKLGLEEITARSTTLFQAWSTAIKKKNLGMVAFLLQEAKEKNLFDSGEYNIIQAISLATAGARGEAVTQLQDSRKTLQRNSPEDTKKLRDTVTLTVAKIRTQSYASAQAKELCAELAPPAPVIAATHTQQR